MKKFYTINILRSIIVSVQFLSHNESLKNFFLCIFFLQSLSRYIHYYTTIFDINFILLCWWSLSFSQKFSYTRWIFFTSLTPSQTLSFFSGFFVIFFVVFFCWLVKFFFLEKFSKKNPWSQKSQSAYWLHHLFNIFLIYPIYTNIFPLYTPYRTLYLHQNVLKATKR